ncbi:MAG: HAD-IIIC family phosphatase [Magnetococcus sp. WYHC-3]
MFEFHQKTPSATLPAAVPPGVPASDADVRRESFMLWGEHCVECTAPACFATCALYQPRPDGRCRRLRHGLNPLGDGAWVEPLSWGKLEARGNTWMWPCHGVRWLERVMALLVALVAPPGRLLAVLTGDPRWRHGGFSLLERLGRWLHRQRRGDGPDALELVLHNPVAVPQHWDLRLAAAAWEGPREALPPPCVVPLVVPPGWFHQRLEYRLFRDVVSGPWPFDVTLTPQADPGEGRAPLLIWRARFITLDAAVRALTPGRLPPVKCIVWDLDGTLWDGVLLEHAPSAARAEMVAWIRHTDHRGILHSIASKNDHEHAMSLLERLGLADLFLHPRIHWQPKSGSVQDIAAALNIGLDAMAFIDDSPFERAEVARALPEVTVLSPEAVPGLATHPRFQGSDSSEARHRRRFYRDALARDGVRGRFGDDYQGFLASCAIKLCWEPYAPARRKRVGELAERTNQLNFSGARYDAAQLDQLLQDPECTGHVLSCRDAFGSYGVVGFAVTRRRGETLELLEFMLSCRVQGKFVEQAFFAALLVAQEPPLQRFVVHFRPSGRNRPAAEALQSMGFQARAEGGMLLELPRRQPRCDFIQVLRRPPAESEQADGCGGED